MTPYTDAVATFLRDAPASDGWGALPFFRALTTQSLLARIDASVAAGAHILPAPQHLLNSLRMTPLQDVRVVILGQDPYPTPGDAHGLAFSYAGQGRLPASLKNIFKEMSSDLGDGLRSHGNLTDWARQGVLLLNTALTVEAGQAGAHLTWGWHGLTSDVMQALGRKKQPCVFLLWGDKARAHAPVIGPHHLIIESAHPSPLAAHRGFFGSRPFSRANQFLQDHGRGMIAWM